MGRPFFSQRYVTASAEPAIRTEPEPKVDLLEREPVPTTWSHTNRFDPDSEEFFSNAEYEAFVDQAPSASSSEPLITARVPVEGDVTVNELPELVSGYDSDGAGLVEVDASSYSDSSDDETPEIEVSSSVEVDQHENPAFIPPAEFRATTPDPTATPSRGAFTRTVDIIPITVAASPAPAPAPATPPPQRSTATTGTPTVLFTPSPPPSVTPRIYRWQHHPIPVIPASPTRSSSYGAGPLFLNSRARTSYSNLYPTFDFSPARVVRIPNRVA